MFLYSVSPSYHSEYVCHYKYIHKLLWKSCALPEPDIEQQAIIYFKANKIFFDVMDRVECMYRCLDIMHTCLLHEIAANKTN